MASFYVFQVSLRGLEKEGVMIFISILSSKIEKFGYIFIQESALNSAIFYSFEKCVNEIKGWKFYLFLRQKCFDIDQRIKNFDTWDTKFP